MVTKNSGLCNFFGILPKEEGKRMLDDLKKIRSKNIKLTKEKNL